MSWERLRHLVAEYKLAEKRLNEIKDDYVRLEASTNIVEFLEKEFVIEKERTKDPKMIKYWQDMIDTQLKNDPDNPDSKDVEKAKKKISGDNEKLIGYYEKKLLIIRKLIGHREAELYEGFAEKNILMGGGNPSKRLLYEMEEEKERKKREENKGGYTFDKM